MAVVIPTIKRTGVGVETIRWSGMGAGDSGEWVNTSRFKKITAHLSGTLTTVALQGSSEAADANPQTLRDATNTLITAAGIVEVLPIPNRIRPLVTDGVAVSVTLTCL